MMIVNDIDKQTEKVFYGKHMMTMKMKINVRIMRLCDVIHDSDFKKRK